MDIVLPSEVLELVLAKLKNPEDFESAYNANDELRSILERPGQARQAWRTAEKNALVNFVNGDA